MDCWSRLGFGPSCASEREWLLFCNARVHASPATTDDDELSSDDGRVVVRNSRLAQSRQAGGIPLGCLMACPARARARSRRRPRRWLHMRMGGMVSCSIGADPSPEPKPLNQQFPQEGRPRRRQSSKAVLRSLFFRRRRRPAQQQQQAMEEDSGAGAGGPSKYVKLIRCVPTHPSECVVNGGRSVSVGARSWVGVVVGKRPLLRASAPASSLPPPPASNTQRRGPRVHRRPEVRLRLQDHRRHAGRCVRLGPFNRSMRSMTPPNTL